jgi:hypothetical protein
MTDTRLTDKSRNDPPVEVFVTDETTTLESVLTGLWEDTFGFSPIGPQDERSWTATWTSNA